MSERSERIVSSYKCPTCNHFLQQDVYKIDYHRYLSQDIFVQYRERQLKKLTFYHTYDGNEDTWCEIDLLSSYENFSVYLQGHHFFNAIPDHPLSELKSPLEEKTKVYSAHISHEEIGALLGRLFNTYDIRLLGEHALNTHPNCNAHHEYSEHSTITLELVNGRIDNITYYQSSVAANIVCTCVCDSVLLKEWFGYY